MPTQEEIDAANEDVSLFGGDNRQSRGEARALRKSEREELSDAQSTRERREIKGRYSRAAEEAINRGGAMKAPAQDDFYKYNEDDVRDQSEQQPSTTYENNNPVEEPYSQETVVDEGGGGGGGTFELDVVKDDNTAGRASFSGAGIIEE